MTQRWLGSRQDVGAHELLRTWPGSLIQVASGSRGASRETLFPEELVGELRADPHGAGGHRAAVASQVGVSFGRGSDQRVTGE